ncbi:MAG: hypothetical protein WA461_07305 [Nitrososphaeraceae archaeon]
MKLVFEKRIELYKRYLKKDSLSDIDKFTLTNKKEWMSRLLNLVIEQELRERITDLTKRVYTLGRHFILALSTHNLNLNHFKRVKILVSGCFHGQPRIHFLKSHAQYLLAP